MQVDALLIIGIIGIFVIWSVNQLQRVFFCSAVNCHHANCHCHQVAFRSLEISIGHFLLNFDYIFSNILYLIFLGYSIYTRDYSSQSQYLI